MFLNSSLCNCNDSLFNKHILQFYYSFCSNKNTEVSYKMDVNSKLMLQFKRKSAIEDDSPKKKSYKYSNS